MKTVLFIDPMNSKLYSASTPFEEALGGTEATVIRIAESLGRFYHVFVAQNHRHQETRSNNNVHYISLEAAKHLTPAPDVCVMVRKYQQLKEFASYYPHASWHLWVHTIPKPSLCRYKKVLRQFHCSIITVSQFQKNLVKNILSSRWYDRMKERIFRLKPITIEVIYNPIDDDLQPDTTFKNKNTLLFLSSPIKGLTEVLMHFTQLKKHFPQFELAIADPGYKIKEDTFSRENLANIPGVRILGKLPRHAIMQELRQAFCVFYPQQQFAETFGLIYAEANAVGTPVLAHDIGAAKEVLENHEQIVDINEPGRVINTITQWQQQGIPAVKPNEKFRLKNITEEWIKLCERKLSCV